MNDVIRTLTNHRSIRSYVNKEVPDEHLKAMVAAAQAAPSWVNGQQVSIIVVKDDNKKKQLAQLVGNQSYVEEAPVFFVFCADFYRAKLAAEKHGEELMVVNDIDSLLVGGVDVGLAMGNTIAAAESLGLGICAIGGIRRNPLEVIELLNLPEHVIPISGLCVGYAKETPDKKPRLPQKAVLHEEEYEHNLKKYIDQYDQTIAEYNKERKNMTWSEGVARFYNKQYYEHVDEMLKKQGFNV
ncbi:NADPH-dependent oxidoreductase [Anaerobacillus sp. MEB173]|uniref:NADPH-dependent oxidoreductase n=1 Tax=Anaerobacillus sp. MEB173 TaxID=3383345 RepID=UPI003F938BFC